MTPTSAALAALLGAGLATGVLLVAAGVRGTHLLPPRRFPARDRRWWARLGIAAAVGVLAGVLTGWPVGTGVAGLATWGLPLVLRSDPAHARRVARIEAIAAWSEMLRDTLAAAAGVEHAILATAPLAPPPIRAQITTLAARIGAGGRLVPALRALADDLADPTGDLVLAALVSAAQQQARQLGDLLGCLAHAAREQASLRLRIEAGRARTRTSVRVITGTTLSFAAAMIVFNRPYLTAYDPITGQIVLAGIGGLFTVGFAGLTRTARLVAPERFLATTADHAVTPAGSTPGSDR